MLNHFPIELCCTHQSERFQFGFAKRALEVLSHDDGTAYQPGPGGLTIVAETEMALERPVRKLAEVFGDEVRIGAPKVRYRNGYGLEQPVMGLRALCSPDHYDAILEDLHGRGASILDAEVNRRFGIVRACAPLAMLLGYPDALRRMTDSKVHLVMWLSHYEQVKPGSPEGTAA